MFLVPPQPLWATTSALLTVVPNAPAREILYTAVELQLCAERRKGAPSILFVPDPESAALRPHCGPLPVFTE
jgi:hypothetical protein